MSNNQPIHDSRFLDMEIIGDNLKRMRIENGLTQKDIAKKLGVSFQQVQKYETGQNKLPIESLLLLKSYYNTTFESFFHGMRSEQCPEVVYDDKAIERTFHKMIDVENEKMRNKIIHIINILLA